MYMIYVHISESCQIKLISVSIYNFTIYYDRERWPNNTQEDGLPSDLADVRIQLALTFTRSEPRRFLSLGLYKRLNQEKVPATISQMKEQVKEIIELIPAEEFRRRIQLSHWKLHCSQGRII